MLTDIGVIFLLLLINGFFAMAEFAIVSSRRGRLRQMAEEDKNRGARQVLELSEDPSAFLSIVQTGVTLVSVMIGAFSGATLGDPLGHYLNQYEWIAPYGPPMGLALTVIGVTYLSLVLGELVPKRIGMTYAEDLAVRVAGVMRVFAWIVAPVVWVLRLSTDMLLHVLRLDRVAGTPVTEEEVKDMIAEGTENGVFKPAEKSMIEGVMMLADRNVRTIMTPRMDMIWLSLDDEAEENAQIIRGSGYSRFPVGRGDLEEVLGVIYARDLLNATMRGELVNIETLMRPAFVVPDTASVLRLLDQFKQSEQPLAIVIDEYGSVEGLVTITDIVESIVGDLPEAGQDHDEAPVRREDGSWLIDGMTPIDEVEHLIGIKNMRDGEDFHTLAGFMIDRLGRLPTSGDVFDWDEARFEVVDMDGRRVDKVLVTPAAEEDAEID